jgi:glycosyltransferase involved in cell wall biosynthesis
MRILQVISTLNPEYGGPVEGLKQMIIELKKQNHSVEVATLDLKSSAWINFFPCRVHTFGKSYFKYRINFSFFFWLIRNKQNYDSVIVNGVWQFHGLAVSLALRNCQTPYYIYTHGMLDPWFKKAFPIKHFKKLLYWILFEKKNLSSARKTLYTTDDEMVLARKSFADLPANGRVVGFGIKGGPAINSNYKNDFYRKFPHLKNKKFYLFLGRIHPKKGCDLLVKAFNQFSDKSQSYEILFLGPDNNNWAKSLRLITANLPISKRITWGGMVDEKTKWTALSLANAFVLPSHSENFGAVIPEALSCKLPVLTTNKVNIWREILKFKAGYVSSDSIDSFGKLFLLWERLSSKEIEIIKMNSRKCFRLCFDVKNAVKRLIKEIK